ncbi:MFS transporter [Cumulibacter soli]|uniref:MFS transporter n=1 Tax=Cumulibacter soli TaxID=2546344 RepID=UPI0010674693|nr:MFS transporter [Cumulibacter soli]
MTSPSRNALLATASIAVALAAADTYVVVLALTDMMAGVGIGIDALQRATPIISGFLLGYIAALPLIGRISDLISRQRVLLWCMAIFIAGSALTALAHDLPTLVAGRVIQGVGGGGLIPATLAIVGGLWPAERRGVPLGIVGAVQELGSVLGPLLGAIVLAVADWRMIFWLNAVLGVALAVVMALLGGVGRRAAGFAPDSAGGATGLDCTSADADADSANCGADLDSGSGDARRHSERRVLRWIAAMLWLVGCAISMLALIAPESLVTSVAYGAPFVPFGDADARLLTPIGVVGMGVLAIAALVTAIGARRVLARADIVGALLIGGALGCVILTFATAEPETEIVSDTGYALLPVAVLLALGYLLHQRRAANPVVPRETFTRRTVLALLVSLLVGVALVAVVVDVPLLARLGYTDDQVAAALVLLRFLVAVPVGALIGGVFVRRFADGVVIALGLVIAAGCLFAMTAWSAETLATATSYVVLVLLGLGMGLTLAPINNIVLARTAPELHGTASAMVVVARMVGMVVGLALLTGIGLNAYYREVAALPDATDADALLDAGLVQVHAVLFGAAIAAAVGAALALVMGVRSQRRGDSEPDVVTASML